MAIPLSSAATQSKGMLEAPNTMIFTRQAEDDILSCRVINEIGQVQPQ